MKVIGIVENNHITGIRYGLVEIPDVIIADLSKAGKTKKRKLKKKNQKHNSVKNTHIKTENIEKETKSANQQKPKRRYHIHATIVCSYNFKTSQKPVVDLSKKRFNKKKDLFKKRQRKDKIALQNLAQRMIAIEPIFDFIENLEKTR